VLNGSIVVFAIEIPVSNPVTVVTYGNNNAVLQRLMFRKLLGEDVAEIANRGIVRLFEASPAAVAENGAVGVGE
jgi:hypothetical protein